MSNAILVDPTQLPAVFACDVGSVSADACHWAQDRVVGHASGDLAALADAIVAAITARRRVSIGLECPLFFPCPENPLHLGRARRGDCVPGVGNRPYSASAGAGSTVAGVPILCWLLRELRLRAPLARGTTDVAAFARGEADVLLWEAFVSGPARGPHHLDDAVAAVAEFVGRWLDDVEC